MAGLPRAADELTFQHQHKSWEDPLSETRLDLPGQLQQNSTVAQNHLSGFGDFGYVWPARVFERPRKMDM